MSLEDLYLRFVFDLVAGRTFDHLHWGLLETPPQGPHELVPAQQRYADALLSMLPEDAQDVMDVGCGLGGIARMLVERKRQVLAVSPRQDHCERIQQAGLPGLQVRCSRFEDLTPEPRFDLLLFAESFNFFVDHTPQDPVGTVAEFARQACSHLRPGGHLLLADIMLPSVYQALQQEPALQLLQEQDVHAEAAHGAQALQLMLERHVVPYHRLLLDVLGHEDRTLAERVERTLQGVQNEPLQLLFRGRMVELDRAQGRRYRMLLMRPAA